MTDEATRQRIAEALKEARQQDNTEKPKAEEPVAPEPKRGGFTSKRGFGRKR